MRVAVGGGREVRRNNEASGVADWRMLVPQAKSVTTEATGISV